MENMQATLFSSEAEELDRHWAVVIYWAAVTKKAAD